MSDGACRASLASQPESTRYNSNEISTQVLKLKHQRGRKGSMPSVESKISTVAAASRAEVRRSPPELPNELEREIFETTAIAHPESTTKLILVSRKVKEWVVPIIYDILIYSPTYNRPSFCSDCPVDSPLFKKVSGYAKNVCIQGVPSLTAAMIMQHCHNMTNLALWSLAGSHQPIVPLISSLPIQRLSVNVRELFQHANPEIGSLTPVLDIPALTNITHLEIISVTRTFCHWEAWKNLALLPCLTHLAIDYSTRLITRDILDNCRHLVILVLYFAVDGEVDGDSDDGDNEYSSTKHADTGIMTDSRVVQMEENVDDMRAWEMDVEGPEDFWKKAERISDKKRIKQ